MDLHSGLPYFLVRNGLPFLYPGLQRDITCDILVVGSGITGALCAHACATAGARVVVIDHRAIGTGSTSASTALLQYEIDTPLHRLAEVIGPEDAVKCYRLCAEAVDGILALAQTLGTPARSRESLQFASRRKHVAPLRKEFALRRKHGLEVEFLEAKALADRFALKKDAALLSRPAAEIDPYAFTHALLQEVIRCGGHVFERSPMSSFQRNGHGMIADLPGGLRISADHLILATGYESQAYLPKPVLSLFSTYAVVSERMEGRSFWEGNCLIWETDQPYTYLRTTADERVIIGGLDEPFKDATRRDRLLDSKARKLVDACGKLFPHLPFRAEYAWCGTFGNTEHGLPIIDQDENSGAWFVLGMGGNGITFSQLGARIVRDSIMGRPPEAASLFTFRNAG